MKEPYYFNHNSAYYSWLKKEVADCQSILDVGCGDGTLIGFLDDGTKKIVGIDSNPDAISKAEKMYGSENTEFICGKFEEMNEDRKFDCVIFVASLHHMDMRKAFIKTKKLLNCHSRTVIVGLYRPSTDLDWVVEALRVIPAAVISKIRKMKSSEELDLEVSYELPELNEIREQTKLFFPGRRISYGLFYRYLMSFKSWI